MSLFNVKSLSSIELKQKLGNNIETLFEETVTVSDRKVLQMGLKSKYIVLLIIKLLMKNMVMTYH